MKDYEITDQKISEIIDWLQSTGSQVQDFAVEQMPLYCQEVIRLGILNGTSIIVAGLILLSVAAVMFWRGCRCKCNIDGELLRGFSVVPLAFGVVAFLIGAFELGKAIVAPRVLILDHIKGLF